MEAITYYNSITGEAVCEPFPKRNFVVPVGYQLTKPVIPKTKEELKQEAKAIRDAAIISGVTTSVRGIVMQCGEYDVTILSLTPIKTFVRDIHNVTHNVTEDEFDSIVNDVKLGYANIIQTYWSTIDNIE
jgi:hypothetical protein